MSKIIVIKTFPLLYGIATNGKIKTVQYTVDNVDGEISIVNEFGYQDGKKQIDRRAVREGKNIGKANETTPEQQALSEATAKWQKKQDENYTTISTGIPAAANLLPMLAHKFNERKHNIVYPCIVQPKLNGVRCLTPVNGTVTHLSRGGKPYENVSHLDADLMLLADNTATVFDGEIYKHGLTLQEINRRVKKHRPGLTEELEYWVYDLAVPNHTNFKRSDMLLNMFGKCVPKRIVLVPTFTCRSEEEVKIWHDQFVQDGFEGVIIRNMKAEYAFDARSADLQKYKEFIDDEFTITGFTSGEGREEGAIIYTCAVKSPKTGGATTFDVRPRGTIEMRKKWMLEGNSHVSKQLTVRYFDLSEDNVPSFPVGVGIREEGE